MSRTVLVAGATGMMGRKIALALQARGAAVRLMVRGGPAHPKSADLQPLTANGAELVDADVSDPSTLTRAVDGVDVIISALQGGPDVIVDGQKALAEAGVKAGVRRIFPSDFSIDHRGLADGEHLFLGWRRRGDMAIAETGLAQTNMLNGAFTEMLLETILGLVDWDGGHIRYWGDVDQPYDFTTTDDTAAYVAAAALDANPPDGAFQVAGDSASPRQLADILSAVTGRAFALQALGTLDDLDAELARRQGQSPDDPMAWVGLQYERAMASGRGKLRAIDNARYPDIKPTSIAAFLRAVRV